MYIFLTLFLFFSPIPTRKQEEKKTTKTKTTTKATTRKKKDDDEEEEDDEEEKRPEEEVEVDTSVWTKKVLPASLDGPAQRS